jgi:hypothetical protein
VLLGQNGDCLEGRTSGYAISNWQQTWSGIFVYDSDGPAFLKRKLVGYGTTRSEIMIAHVDWCPFMFQEHLIGVGG